MKRWCVWLTAIFMLCQAASAAPRLALLQSMTDFDQRPEVRTALAAFDVRLQAELLTASDAELVARSGLSAVVFEQKLKTIHDASTRPVVLPADFSIISILDFPNRELRVYVSRVKEGMTLADAQIFGVENLDHVRDRLPGEVARRISTTLKLGSARKPSSAEITTGKVVCAMLPPVAMGAEQAAVPKVATLLQAGLEQVMANDAGLGVEWVERAQAMQLLEEKRIADVWDPNAASRLGPWLRPT